MTAYAMLLGAGDSKIIDDYFKYVTMLLPGNGTNGAQNNTFLDSSTNNFTITRNGNTTQGTFSPYGDNWSVYQSDPEANYINFKTSVGSAFEFTGDYTIEAWVFITANTGDNSVYVTNIGSNYHALNIDVTNFNVYLNSGSPTSSFAHGLSNNVWNHVAMVRSGSTVTVYANGVSKGTITNSATNGYANPTIARNGGGSPSTQVRYMSNLRVVKGTAVYTSAFTPPTTPLTAISGTQLLTCQGNRFYDASSNNFTITVNGTPSVQRFSPFSPSAAYSAATIGGSGYFDGSGDDLMVVDNAALEFGSGAFTVEAWIYPVAAPGTYASIVSKYAAGAQDSYYFTLESGRQIRFGISAAEVTTTTTVPLNAWSHVAATRSGNTFTIWINGVSSGTFTSSASVKDTTAKTGIGNFDGYSVYFNGYISDARIVKGTAVYTAGFTPPTAPLTAITNTSLLCNMTNAGIIDNAMMNDLETAGNAQISTTQSKFGGSSMYFDGNGDYLVSPNTNNFILGGPFTIEAWVYRSTSTSRIILVEARSPSLGYANYLFNIIADGTIEFAVSGSTNYYNPSETVASGQWVHVALVRDSSNVVKAYINGTGAATTKTITGVLTPAGSSIWIGARRDPYYSDGYIDDLRITKGYARYTANFTPPTAAFPTS